MGRKPKINHSKEYINEQIVLYYREEDSKSLANRLGITLSLLRVRAKRLGIKKGTTTNRIINGKKLCPYCKRMLSVEEFYKDKYQPNNLDYYCKGCRKIYEINKKTAKQLAADKIAGIHRKPGSLAFNLGKKRNNPILINGQKYLRCKNCLMYKPLTTDYFNIDSKMSHGHKNYCKDVCEKENRKQAKERGREPSSHS